MANKSALTVKPTEEITETQQKESGFARREDTGIVHTPDQGMVQSKHQALEAQAIALAELNTTFDPDYVAAALEQYLKHQEELIYLIDTEVNNAKLFELERLAALDFAREKGVQEARQEHRQKVVEPALAKMQQDFANNQLPRIMKINERKLNGTPEGEKLFKQSVEGFAHAVGFTINWETVNGKLKATPKLRSGS